MPSDNEFFDANAPNDFDQASQVPPVEHQVESSGTFPPQQPHPDVVGPREGWLHPTSIVFDLISNGRQNLVPALIGIFGAANGSWGFAIFAIVIFGLSFLISAFRYFTLRYSIHNGELTVRQGLIFKRVRTVPLKRIQNIDSTQNVLHRLLKVAEVRVETASGNEPEAKLRVLSLDKIAELRETVFQHKPATSTATPAAQLEPSGSVEQPSELSPTIDSKPTFEAPAETVLHTISLIDLLKAGVASNRGTLVFGVLAGLYFQFDLEERFDIKKLANLLPQGLGFVQTAISIAVAVLIVFVLMRIYGAVWYVLRFSGYQLVQRGEDFKVTCGLFTRVAATIPLKRIQFISVHRSLFMRMFGLASIRIETAGGAGAKAEDATSSVGRRWFIPVIKEEDVHQMLTTIRPGLEWHPEQVNWVGVADRTASRLCRLAVIEALVVAAGGLFISLTWGWTAGLIVLPGFVWLAIKQSRAMRFAETDFGVAYRSGVLTKKLSLTFFNRIQNIRFDQSPFDRRWGMASLSIDTAAAGPADHRVNVKYLDAAFAKRRFQELTNKLAG